MTITATENTAAGRPSGNATLAKSPGLGSDPLTLAITPTMIATVHQNAVPAATSTPIPQANRDQARSLRRQPPLTSQRAHPGSTRRTQRDWTHALVATEFVCASEVCGAGASTARTGKESRRAAQAPTTSRRDGRPVSTFTRLPLLSQGRCDVGIRFDGGRTHPMRMWPRAMGNTRPR